VAAGQGQKLQSKKADNATVPLSNTEPQRAKQSHRIAPPHVFVTKMQQALRTECSPESKQMIPQSKLGLASGGMHVARKGHGRQGI